MIAVALAILGFLPIANWLPGGEADRAYARRWIEWGYGTAICLGAAVIAIVLLRRRLGPKEPKVAAQHRAPEPERSDGAPRARVARVIGWLAPLLALGVYAWISRSVFSGRPLLIDELVQLFQARIFASGRLWLPVAEYQEFFSILHVVDTGDKVYSQFPPGGPAMLALGVLARSAWLVGPVSGAVAVALFAKLVPLTDPEAPGGFHAGATTLFAVAPFGAFMFGSHMNHATALMWILLAVLGLAKTAAGGAARGTRGTDAWAFICGFGLGAAATIRPLDAFAFALPAAVWLVTRAMRDRSRWTEVGTAGLGVAIPFGAMLWVNAQSTGSPLLFGYEVLWGQAHGLGFHAAPWGAVHTPARGLELLSLYVTRLQAYLFETPFPALAPAIAALALTKRISALDRYLLACAVLLGALYFAYWHDGFFLGPRFVFPWLPVLVLWTARLPRLAREAVHRRSQTGSDAGRSRLLSLGLGAALATGAVMTAAISLPVRIAQYRGGLTSMRVDYAAEAARAGARDALVFVRESWGAQLVTRMWARGVSRGATSALYSNVDACALDKALRTLERDGVRGDAAEARLSPLLADSARVRSSPLSPDSTEKLLPGAMYDRTCIARINDDRVGYAHLAPLLLEQESGNVYARDLQAHDSLLLAEYPSRPTYLLRRRGADAGAPHEWLPLRRDSLLAAWRSGTP